MLKNDLYANKLLMLNEFEKQLDYIFSQYDENNLEKDDCLKSIQKLKKAWSLNRIDIRNMGNESNSIKYLEYEKFVNISYPAWFKGEKGKGSIVLYKKNDTSLFLECINDGNLEISCKGIDFNNIDIKRVPVCLNFTKVIINEEVVFEGNEVVWHDKPLIFRKKCVDSEIVFLKIESKSIDYYFPELFSYLDNFTKKTDIHSCYKEIRKIIEINKNNILECL